MGQYLAQWIDSRPVVVLVTWCLLGALATLALYDWAEGQWRLSINPSVQALLPVSGQPRDNLDRVNRHFGETEAIIVALYPDELFGAASLKAIGQITQALQTLPGVARVWSLDTAPVLAARDDELNMTPFTQAALDPGALKRAALDNPLYRDSLVTRQGDATTIVVYLSEANEAGGLLLSQVREIVADKAPGMVARYAGPPVLKAATSDALVRELRRVIPAIFVFIALFLAVGFRSVRGLVIPMATLGLALWLMLAFIVLTGRKLNLITAMVPPVVITIGLAYSLHMVNSILRHADHDRPVRKAIGEVAVPLLITAMTTAAGFLALALSPLTAVRDFAWLAAVGIVLTALLSLTLLPALFSLSGCRALKRPPGRRQFMRLAVRLGHFNARYRQTILAAGAIVCVIALLGMPGITANTDYIRGFAADAPVRVDHETINRDFSGATPLSIMLETSDSGGFAQPDKLRRLADLQARLAEHPDVGYSRSVADMVKVLNRALHGGEAAHYRIPDTETAVRQTLLFGSTDALSTFVDRGFGKAHILLNARVSDSASIASVVDAVESELARLDPAMSGRVTGTPVLVSDAVDAITGGQFLTVGVALAVVFLLLWGLFTSARSGALALVPNVIPVLVYFGVLGYSGIPLNPTTSLVACIVLGIAVDDTLYYFARFNQDARRLASESRATVSALRSVLRPVTYSSAALIAGFIALSFSSLQNQAQFGALAAFTLGIAWIIDVTFTPALAAGVRIVTLWDVLRLDLGERPQASIPLFEDMSLRRARLFALIANLEPVRAGECVLREGEQGSEMYVVIDGELRVWVDREGQAIELARLQRGAVLGEVGHFSSRRTANVDAVTDGRLLRFGARDLERLRRRSPRTAALAFRNLNRIQAQRLAQVTERLRH